MTSRWQNLSGTTKVGIGAMIIMSIVVIVGVITTLWLSDDASDEPNSDTNVTVESPETAPDDPPSTETNTSPEFDTFVPSITRISVVPNDVAVYVFCDGSTRVYVMNTVSPTKQLEIVRDFPGCRGERMVGEQIPG